MSGQRIYITCTPSGRLVADRVQPTNPTKKDQSPWKTEYKQSSTQISRRRFVFAIVS